MIRTTLISLITLLVVTAGLNSPGAGANPVASAATSALIA